MTGLTIETAAKINLCLRVLGRRADAYHEVETVLHTVGVWDRIALYDHPTDISITVLTGDVPQGEDNLCWQAASRLAERTGIKRGVSITVEKTIPLAPTCAGTLAKPLTSLGCLRGPVLRLSAPNPPPGPIPDGPSPH